MHDSDNQYDYIIITIDDYVQSCEIFASHKEIYNGFKVLVTTKSDIVNEFNVHTDPQENIRDFISYTGNNWKEPTPKYFLIAAKSEFPFP